MSVLAADSASDGSVNPAVLSDIRYEDYIDERQLPAIQQLVAGDLSEPYSVFTYRYFLLSWPNLCICVYDYAVSPRALIGTIICKVDNEFGSPKGYIAMLAVDKRYRKCGIGSKLVIEGMRRMVAMNCDEIHLETEVRL
jgi:peptide alpha-N-acetyltransferase